VAQQGSWSNAKRAKHWSGKGTDWPARAKGTNPLPVKDTILNRLLWKFEMYEERERNKTAPQLFSAGPFLLWSLARAPDFFL
jgi:hypothetical protein